jgi:nucleoid-associated protein YgaU
MGQPVITVPISPMTVGSWSGQTVVDTVQTNAVAVFGPPVTGPAAFSYYTVVDGDRFDLISYKVYGLPDYWWRIANANPEIFYPDSLVVGSIIRIPNSS